MGLDPAYLEQGEDYEGVLEQYQDEIGLIYPDGGEEEWDDPSGNLIDLDWEYATKGGVTSAGLAAGAALIGSGFEKAGAAVSGVTALAGIKWYMDVKR